MHEHISGLLQPVLDRLALLQWRRARTVARVHHRGSAVKQYLAAAAQ